MMAYGAHGTTKAWKCCQIGSECGCYQFPFGSVDSIQKYPQKMSKNMSKSFQARLQKKTEAQGLKGSAALLIWCQAEICMQ
jgi:hypothetical protein